ncbi:MAG: flagellar transcriptional regulator FlhC [Burkholderiales bacterium]|nr:Flagellar transcriptional regulator FlhC [Rhodocyclaceae bacterium]MCQ3924651.1 flagellar transcriptional regulator FlhC [Rhodocyclaceae bacterium]MCZ2420694.1 flagellar transcriptional regulator FlhC [Burkholderiales bacterium]
MRNKSVVTEAREIQLAAELIRLGARLQLLEAETHLSRERLLKLYKEVKGVSPPKGMLPFSTDWFLTWQPNVHASLFMSFHRFMLEHTGLSGLNAVVKAYRLYLEHIELHGMECALSLTRAWTLVRFFDANMLKLAQCLECGGHFVAHAQDLTRDYACGLCHVPARAGKTKRRAEALAASV